MRARLHFESGLRWTLETSGYVRESRYLDNRGRGGGASSRRRCGSVTALEGSRMMAVTMDTVLVFAGQPRLMIGAARN